MIFVKRVGRAISAAIFGLGLASMIIVMGLGSITLALETDGVQCACWWYVGVVAVTIPTTFIVCWTVQAVRARRWY